MHIFGAADKQDRDRVCRTWPQRGENTTGARTPQGKAISSRNVLVGNTNRAKALAIARQELREVEQKVFRLSRGKENPCLDRLIQNIN